MTEPDECQLEEELSQQHIGAEVFLPFVITRLQTTESDVEATISVTLRNIISPDEVTRTLTLRWQSANVPVQPLAVQEKVVTEWVACGIACAVLSVYARLDVLSVAEEGERFDYWVGDVDAQEYGLEVSGTLSDSRAEIEARHRVKVSQLLSNPYGVNGFVVVVGFATREVILSFHRFGQEE